MAVASGFETNLKKKQNTLEVMEAKPQVTKNETASMSGFSNALKSSQKTTTYGGSTFTGRVRGFSGNPAKRNSSHTINNGTTAGTMKSQSLNRSIKGSDKNNRTPTLGSDNKV
jgi:hypothetical protein